MGNLRRVVYVLYFGIVVCDVMITHDISKNGVENQGRTKSNEMDQVRHSEGMMEQHNNITNYNW